MASLNPYLTFNGTCEAAFNHYKSVFGGEFTMMGRFNEMPSEQPVPEAVGNLIMHVSYQIGPSVLMGSDTAPGMGPVVIEGTNFSVSVDTESEEEATRIFEGLSKGGKIVMPLEKTFWGAFFGMCTDPYGVNWMVNFDYKK